MLAHPQKSMPCGSVVKKRLKEPLRHSRYPITPTPFRVYGHPMLLVTSVTSTVQNLFAGWRDRFSDFEIFYASTATLRQGLNPYATVLATRGPNINPPLVVWLMQPLSAFSYGMTAALWIVLATAAVLWSIWAIQRVTGHGWVVLAAVLITQAGILPLRRGQVTWVTATVSPSSFRQSSTGRFDVKSVKSEDAR
jgi:hypothetical protein